MLMGEFVALGEREMMRVKVTVYCFACFSKRPTPSNIDLLTLFVITNTEVSLCEMTISTTQTTQNNYRKKKKIKNTE